MTKRSRVVLASAVAGVLPVLGLAVSHVSAQSIVAVGYSSGFYTQNFDALPSTTPNSQNTGSLTMATGVGSASTVGPFALNSTNIYSGSSNNPSQVNGWFFGRTTGNGGTFTFVWDTGTGSSGAIYNYGTAGATDRALGTLASGSTTPRIGLVLQNTSSTTFTAFALDYIAEQWRSSTVAQNVLTFGYSVGSDIASLTDMSAAPQFTESSLDAKGKSPVGSNGTTNGNLAENRTAVSGVAQPSGFTWAPGQYLALYWTDVNDGGNDAGIAIDDFSFEAGAATTTPAGAVNWTGATNSNWDTSTANWSGNSSSTYVEQIAVGGKVIGDSVTFGNTGAGTVTVTGSGVTPSAVLIDSSSNYLFQGGPIKGTTSVVKRGGGTLRLTSSNTFSGGVRIEDGTLEYSNDNQLGDGASTLTLGSNLYLTTGKLLALGNLAGTRSVVVAPSAGGVIDTNGFEVQFGSLVAGREGSLTLPVEFHKMGAGNLILTTSLFVAYGSTFEINTGSIILNAPGNINGNGISGSSSTTGWAGDLVVATNNYVNFGAGQFGTRYIGGGGKIYFDGAGLGTNAPSQGTNFNISGLGAYSGTNVIMNDVIVNRANVDAYRLQVGANFFDATLQLDAPIIGKTDVGFAYQNYTGGQGIVLLNVPMQYTGKTYILGGVNSVVRLGVDNALPVGTDVSFGQSSNNAATIGALDLNGHTQSIASLQTINTSNGTNAPNPSTILGIVNTSSDTAATLVITGSATTTYTGGIGTPVAASSNVQTASTLINLTMAPSHTGHLTLTGAAGLLDYSGTTKVEGGTLTIAKSYRPASGGALQVSGSGVLELSGSTASDGPVVAKVSSVSVSGTGSVVIAQSDRSGGAVARALVTDSLTVTGGFLDVKNNDVFVIGGSVSSLTASVASWWNDGLRNGTGIGSSLSGLAGENELATLAVAQNVNGSGGTIIPSIGDVTLSTSDVVIKYTYLGDTDLDGQVTSDDLQTLIRGIRNHLTGWANGDNNYDGVVDGDDLANLLLTLQLQGDPFLTGAGTGGTGSNGGAVPEPAALGLVLAGVPLVGRRRRK